jgi:hypothetical protein
MNDYYYYLIVNEQLLVKMVLQLINNLDYDYDDDYVDYVLLDEDPIYTFKKKKTISVIFNFQ